MIAHFVLTIIPNKLYKTEEKECAARTAHGAKILSKEEN